MCVLGLGYGDDDVGGLLRLVVELLRVDKVANLVALQHAGVSLGYRCMHGRV